MDEKNVVSVTLSYEDQEGNPIEYSVDIAWGDIINVINEMDTNAQ